MTRSTLGGVGMTVCNVPRNPRVALACMTKTMAAKDASMPMIKLGLLARAGFGNGAAYVSGGG